MGTSLALSEAAFQDTLVLKERDSGLEVWLLHLLTWDTIHSSGVDGDLGCFPN